MQPGRSAHTHCELLLPANRSSTRSGTVRHSFLPGLTWLIRWSPPSDPLILLIKLSIQNPRKKIRKQYPERKKERIQSSGWSSDRSIVVLEVVITGPLGVAFDFLGVRALWSFMSTKQKKIQNRRKKERKKVNNYCRVMIDFLSFLRSSHPSPFLFLFLIPSRLFPFLHPSSHDSARKDSCVLSLFLIRSTLTSLLSIPSFLAFESPDPVCSSSTLVSIVCLPVCSFPIFQGHWGASVWDLCAFQIQFIWLFLTRLLLYKHQHTTVIFQ